MSIICKPVEEAIRKRASTARGKEFVRATIDPKTKHQLNFPIDYQFHEVFLCKKYAELADRFQNFEIRPDDIWICGFPKTGTVWMQNIARKLTQNLDFDAPLVRTVRESFEFEIYCQYLDVPNNEEKEEFIKFDAGHFEHMNQMPSPRILKSHLPPFLLPKEIWTKKAKVIYMARNPKDAAISNYHMLHNGNLFVPSVKFSLEEMFQLMIEGKTMFAPFPEHVLSFWILRKLDHVLFMTYEKLSADRFAGCKKVSEFLGYNYDDVKLQELAGLVEFNSMKKRIIEPPLLTGHCRKGEVGGYRNEMSQEWIERFDQWIEYKFKNTDFDYSQWL